MPPSAFGLPSNPRGRVGTSPFQHSAASPRPSIAQTLPRNPGEHRSNRSVTSLPTRPTVTRQLHETQPPRPPAQPSRNIDTYGEEYTPRRSRESDHSSASSSSGSSIWAREAASQRSSRTTLQSYDGDDGFKDVSQLPPKDTTGDPSTFNVDTGHVWSRVTEAANVITGVGKVLASGLASYSGGDEEEPDNHLTNVLRAYHLAKAASPSDLPDWLFTERERRLPGFQQSEASSEGQARGDRLAQTSETSYRRDIHRTQYLERTFEQPPEPTYRRESPSQSSQSRAFGDRLRDLRKVPGASSIPSRRQY